MAPNEPADGASGEGAPGDGPRERLEALAGRLRAAAGRLAARLREAARRAAAWTGARAAAARGRLAGGRERLAERRRRKDDREDSDDREGEEGAEAGPPRGPAVPRLRGAATILAGRDDDALAIIGRVEEASEVEILLVVPRGARGLRDEMAWPRIAAHARQRGLRLRVLASRREVRQHAAGAGLAAARTLRGLRPRRALRLRLGASELTLRAPPIAPLLRLAAFAAAAAVPIGAAALFVPSADILVAPPSEPLGGSLRVHLNPVAETDIANGVVAASSISETIATVVSTVATGVTTVGDERASARLEFTNEGASDIRLPIGTPVDDEGGFTFTTDAPVTVPAGGTVTVGATSIRPGTGGNLEADALRLLIGFPPTLTVTNPAAASGGSDAEASAASAEDVVRVDETAEEVLRRAGARALTRAVANGTVFTGTVAVSILGREPLVQPGEPADVFLMEYTAIVSALVLTDEAAVRAGERLLVHSLPDGMALLPGATEASVARPSWDGSRLTAELTATGLAAPLIDPASLRGALTGVSPETAAARLRERLGLRSEPLISLHPGWLPLPRMPLREDRISIALVAPEALAAAAAGEDASDDEEAADGEDGGDE